MGSVDGQVRSVLRIEGLAVMLLCVYLYHLSEFSWLTFAILFFCPDLAFIAYLVSKKIGAIIYNLAHSYSGVVLVAFAYLILGLETLKLLSIVWAAHVGFDRALGYGLKYSRGFAHTHLGELGNAKNKNT